MSRRLLLVFVLGALAVGAGAWTIHRATLAQALEILQLPELRAALADARVVAREAHRGRVAAGLPDEDLRAREGRMDRAALVLEQARLLPDELSAHIAAAAFAPFFATLLLLGLLLAAYAAAQLRPLAQVTAAVLAWSRGDEGGFPLGRAGPEDVARLREALDSMVERIRGQRGMLAAQSRALGWRQVALETSHELKNLLTPVRMAAERIAERAGGDDEMALLAAVGPLERLARVLGDLGRRERGSTRPVRVRELLAACAALHAARGLVVEVDAAVDLSVTADADALREALANLVTNAAEAGATRVSLRARRAAGSVVLSCEDDGPGLSALPPPGSTNRAGGSGFGLSFARRVAEEHGGELHLAAPARGTMIVMELPDGQAARGG